MRTRSAAIAKGERGDVIALWRPCGERCERGHEPFQQFFGLAGRLARDQVEQLAVTELFAFVIELGACLRDAVRHDEHGIVGTEGERRLLVARVGEGPDGAAAHVEPGRQITPARTRKTM